MVETRANVGEARPAAERREQVDEFAETRERPGVAADDGLLERLLVPQREAGGDAVAATGEEKVGDGKSRCERGEKRVRCPVRGELGARPIAGQAIHDGWN